MGVFYRYRYVCLRAHAFLILIVTVVLGREGRVGEDTVFSFNHPVMGWSSDYENGGSVERESGGVKSSTRVITYF
ncbi:hypothetical protein NPIL_36771 [Nephila pilipes]|uniref:Secreted protein n=1 Tax=Nephila pilipes TaxID=299642 RepID=A0A8X6TM11_NEPPI|nr:hypothetical protein NPIL_36771 [Nephila pilipes]